MSFTGIVGLRNSIISVNPVTSLILEDSGFTKYWVFIDSTGTLQTVSGAVGTALNIKVTGGSGTEAALKVSTSGELQVDNAPAGGETLDDNLRIRAIGGTGIYRIEVSSLDEITTELV